MNGFFITGTDTDIGKTALSALLLAELRERGIQAAPMKPAQTGCENNRVPDLDYSLSMANFIASDEDYALMSPARFAPACSPHLAAQQAGTEIQLAQLTTPAQQLSEKYESLVIEGAGGVLVPINPRETMLNLMQRIQLPVIVAAPPGLGSINHTLLSLHALRAAKVDVAGVVFIERNTDCPPFIEKDNGRTIEQFGETTLLGKIPYCPALQTLTPSFTTLPAPVRTAIKHITDQLLQN